jgi:nucleotide-binding universal stress UspA family protein
MRRILVGLDGSPLAESILGSVRALARRLGAEVSLLHVVHLPASFHAEGDVTLDGLVERERREAERYLHRIARELETAGVTAHTAVAVGEPAAEIVRSADRDDVDLLALATHGRSGVQRWLHGSVADAVLHTTTRPLLLLRPSLGAPPGAVERLIVPLDGSAIAEDALPTGRELARRLDVPLELLGVVEPVTLAFAGDPIAQTAFDYPRMLAMLEEGTRAYLDAIAARERRDGLRVETTVRTGVAPDTIARVHAERPGSLLVIGSHGRTGWRAAVLGSVARRVVALSTGPVMVVRPRAARA